MIPPVGAVLILHYFMHRDEYEENAKAEIRAVNMPAILAVVAGSLVGVFVTAGIKPVNSRRRGRLRNRRPPLREARLKISGKDCSAMLVKNIFIENSTEAKDIRVTDGKFEVAQNLTPREGEEVVDGAGKLAIPPFIESHVHLDTCLTAGDPVWNLSGTLFEGIECWSKRKEKLSKEDVKERVRRATSART